MNVTRFEAFHGNNVFQVEVFWFVTPCRVVVGYQRFRGPRMEDLDFKHNEYRHLRRIMSLMVECMQIIITI
jgi:hypothetical protein